MTFQEELKKQLENECIFSASRSSGPGGQNVNKVNTRIELRFRVDESPTLTDAQKHRIHLKLKNRINAEGELILVSESERTQLRNRQKVLENFFIIVGKALTLQKKRIRTTLSASSKLKRLESKKILSQKKQLRKPPGVK